MIDDRAWMDGCLYRYMPLDACERMVRQGVVRFAASNKIHAAEQDPTGERQDDEHHAKVTLLGDIEGVVGTRGDSSVTASHTRMKDRTELEARLTPPFWMLCLSTRNDRFEMFQESAAVEILDVPAFRQRLKKACVELIPHSTLVLPPNRRLTYADGWFDMQAVDYGDELLAYGRSTVSMNPAFRKPSRFKHQGEVRAACGPKQVAGEHTNVRLRMDDIATVVRRH